MVIIIKKILLIFNLFFLFNTLEIDSNSDKILLYDKSNAYESSDFKVYFRDMNSKELDSILNILKVSVRSYIIEDKEYYARNIDELVSEYIKDKSVEEKCYYIENGITIDGVNITCEVGELIKLENLSSVY